MRPCFRFFDENGKRERTRYGGELRQIKNEVPVPFATLTTLKRGAALDDPDHADDEDRFLLLGLSANLRTEEYDFSKGRPNPMPSA